MGGRTDFRRCGYGLVIRHVTTELDTLHTDLVMYIYQELQDHKKKKGALGRETPMFVNSATYVSISLSLEMMIEIRLKEI